jgi:ABC-type phosphate/phosphonate transport system permease subunit
MDMLKKFFPVSFSFADTVVNLVVGILIYVVAGAIVGAVMGIIGLIPIIGILASIIGYVFGLYCTAGIVIELLVFFKVIK